MILFHLPLLLCILFLFFFSLFLVLFLFLWAFLVFCPPWICVCASALREASVDSRCRSLSLIFVIGISLGFRGSCWLSWVTNLRSPYHIITLFSRAFFLERLYRCHSTSGPDYPSNLIFSYLSLFAPLNISYSFPSLNIFLPTYTLFAPDLVYHLRSHIPIPLSISSSASILALLCFYFHFQFLLFFRFFDFSTVDCWLFWTTPLQFERKRPRRSGAFQWTVMGLIDCTAALCSALIMWRSLHVWAYVRMMLSIQVPANKAGSRLSFQPSLWSGKSLGSIEINMHIGSVAIKIWYYYSIGACNFEVILGKEESLLVFSENTEMFYRF